MYHKTIGGKEGIELVHSSKDHSIQKRNNELRTYVFIDNLEQGALKVSPLEDFDGPVNGDRAASIRKSHKSLKACILFLERLGLVSVDVAANTIFLFDR